MNTRAFWKEHFAQAEPTIQAAFVGLTPADCAEVLERLGAPRVEGVTYESAENRVFGFGDVVLKFYRPGRWDLAALQDELQFLEDLREADVPFVRPIGEVGTWRGIHYIAYEAVPTPFALSPETLDEDSVRALVHLFARFHEVGARRPALARPQYDPAGMCAGCFDVICDAGYLPESLKGRYQEVIDRLVPKFAPFGDVPIQRIHGDAYSGNAIWRPDGPVFMDLDDFQMGPVAMDVGLLSFPWRLDTLPASMDRRKRRKLQHELVLRLYRELRPFPEAWEPLFPLLRVCRDILFDAWFSAYWSEPGFADNYPDDNITDPAWWLDSIESLERSLHATPA